MANHKDKAVDLSSLYFDPYFMEKTQEVVNCCKKYNTICYNRLKA